MADPRLRLMPRRSSVYQTSIWYPETCTVIRHVRDFLGHADLDTTKSYLRLIPGHLRADYDKAMPTLAGALPVTPPLSPGPDAEAPVHG